MELTLIDISVWIGPSEKIALRLFYRQDAFLQVETVQMVHKSFPLSVLEKQDVSVTFDDALKIAVLYVAKTLVPEYLVNVL